MRGTDVASASERLAAPVENRSTASARRVLTDILDCLEGGGIRLRDSGESRIFGDANGPTITITIREKSFYNRVVFGGTIGAAEAYALGWWECDDLPELIRLLAHNRPKLRKLDWGFGLVRRLVDLGWHYLRPNSRRGSRLNIAAHYDLSNDFYRLWLDDSMTYSAGIYESDDTPLTDAQRRKLDQMCRLVGLTGSDHLLEIGTGWGSLAMHAAREYGCRVTTTTISQNQFDEARRRVQQAHLNDRITVLQSDYRDLSGQYDKLISVEMIEAIGHRQVPRFVDACQSLVRPGGRVAIQAITMNEGTYRAYRHSVDFIKRYIFPGSCLISLDRLRNLVARQTNFVEVACHDLTSDYARTLADWRQRFHYAIDDVRQLGFGDTFTRMWDFYLAYCEGGFRARYIGDIQIAWQCPE